jgi:hypothetical protein
VADLERAVATVRAFIQRSGAARVVLVLDEGETAPPSLVELSTDGLEVMANGAPVRAPKGGAPAALPDIRPAPPSAVGIDLERGQIEAPLGTVAHLAEVVLALARTGGGRSVATAEFRTRDPDVPLTIAAREGEPVVLSVADRQFLLPDGI